LPHELRSHWQRVPNHVEHPPYRIIASMSDFCRSSETARVGVASFGTPGAPTHWTRPSNEEKQKQHHQAQGDDKKTESKRTGFRSGVVYFPRHLIVTPLAAGEARDSAENMGIIQRGFHYCSEEGCLHDLPQTGFTSTFREASPPYSRQGPAVGECCPLGFF
jgi:hypothetical protein